ncbi:hypothetical protein SAMN05444172_9024 [Burkholderia sp. GAS332]|nr:hypothetical protein SAMN05444172_9024 [Burkholderia sp. GAS332]
MIPSRTDFLSQSTVAGLPDSTAVLPRIPARSRASPAGAGPKPADTTKLRSELLPVHAMPLRKTKQDLEGILIRCHISCSRFVDFNGEAPSTSAPAFRKTGSSSRRDTRLRLGRRVRLMRLVSMPGEAGPRNLRAGIRCVPPPSGRRLDVPARLNGACTRERMQLGPGTGKLAFGLCPRNRQRRAIPVFAHP